MKERFSEKEQKHVLKCKEAAWKRFHREYLVALREEHNLNHNDKLADIHIGNVMIIIVESKNREHWKLVFVEKLYSGKDRVIRVVRLQTQTN